MIFLFRQNGTTLVEALAYLGIAALVILAVASLIGSSISDIATDRTQDQVIAIRSAVKRLYANGHYGVGVVGAQEDLTADLIRSSAFPSTLNIDQTSSTVKNQWGGKVIVYGMPGRFTIRYDNVPEEICIRLLAASHGWYIINVNQQGNWISFTQFPVTGASATAACAGGVQKFEWNSR